MNAVRNWGRARRPLWLSALLGAVLLALGCDPIHTRALELAPARSAAADSAAAEVFAVAGVVGARRGLPAFGQARSQPDSSRCSWALGLILCVVPTDDGPVARLSQFHAWRHFSPGVAPLAAEFEDSLRGRLGPGVRACTLTYVRDAARSTFWRKTYRRVCVARAGPP